MYNSSAIYEIVKEQKDVWTNDQLSAMTQEQKDCLTGLVRHMNPEIFTIRKDETRERWIKILSGVYLRYVKCYDQGESYNTAEWRAKAERIK